MIVNQITNSSYDDFLTMNWEIGQEGERKRTERLNMVFWGKGLNILWSFEEKYKSLGFLIFSFNHLDDVSSRKKEEINKEEKDKENWGRIKEKQK